MTSEPEHLPHPCEFTCQACGKKAAGILYGGTLVASWRLPSGWRTEMHDSLLVACSRACLDTIAERKP